MSYCYYFITFSTAATSSLATYSASSKDSVEYTGREISLAYCAYAFG